MGNYLALSTGAPGLYYKYPRTEQDDRQKVADHGGLTPEEMIVPLIVARG